MKYLTLLLVLITCATGLCADEKAHDQAEFRRIKALIGSDPEALFGKSLDQFVTEFEIKNVAWNFAYTNAPKSEARIYHFEGFYLFVHLRLLPKGVDFHKRPRIMSSTGAELRKSGTRYISAFYPYVRIDGINRRPHKRMSKHWEAIEKGVREKMTRAVQKRNQNNLEQGGAEKPASAPQSKPESKEKPKSEAEVRPR